MAVPKTIDEYIAAAAPAARPVLRRIRSTARRAASGSEETISYGMPTLKQGRVLLHFAAFKGHIGVFPPVRGNAVLERAVAKYAGPKGNLRFPLDGPIPYGLIERIVRFRVKVGAAKKTVRRRAG